eukprot:23606_5
MDVRLLQARNSINLGNVILGQRIEQELTIQNYGQQPITLSSITHSKDLFPGEIEIIYLPNRKKILSNQYDVHEVFKDNWLYLKSCAYLV